MAKSVQNLANLVEFGAKVWIVLIGIWHEIGNLHFYLSVFNT